jgi:YHS domain-containing protein
MTLKIEVQKFKDPVCGMVVDEHKIVTSYEGVHYVFCSNQCQERFESNPHLYIGHPGHKAPKQEGVKLVKIRRFKLEHSLSLSDAKVLANELYDMMGIMNLQINDMDIEVTYDLMEATAEQIENKMVEIGINLGEKWAQVLRREFIHLIEETEVSSMEEEPKIHRHGNHPLR